MGREIKRVPLDFDHPLKEVWSGFLMPGKLDGKKCGICDGSGYSGYARWMQARWYGNSAFDPSETGSTPLTPETPAVRAFAERNVERDPEFYTRFTGTSDHEQAVTREATRLCRLWNGAWSHHLEQADVDALVEEGRLRDLTHTWKKGDGWQAIVPAPAVTPEQVNEWSLRGFGHDGINSSIVVRAKCDREGHAVECDRCEGHGTIEVYPGQRAEAEAWEPIEPPAGDGYQLWETVSEGSPISPVFALPGDLAVWMTENDCTVGGPMASVDAALRFINAGWAPSLVFTPQTGVVDGTTFAGREG